jgi:ubiquitin carboxyl-terminal hydrolase 4/11/15
LTDSEQNQNYYSKREAIAGVCGLTNLGNTCFMNSALQCLSNIPILTEFVLNSYDRKSSFLNIMGKNRKKLFDYYYDIIKQFWFHKYSNVIPKEFRIEVSRKGPQFRADEQNDCCEFLIFILDAFHEELNQYNPNKDHIIDWQSINRNEDFSQYLSHYKRVNSSIISENFYGFQKNSLNCICGESFATNFSPFSCLPLPHPKTNGETDNRSENWRKLKINLIPYFENSLDINTFYFEITIPKDGIVVNHIRNETAKFYNKFCGKNLDHNYLIVTEVINSEIRKVYEKNDFLSQTITDLTVYESSPLFKRQLFVTLVTQRIGTLKAFGLPILINTDNSSYKNLSQAFVKVFSKFLDSGKEGTELIELRIDRSAISYCTLLDQNNFFDTEPTINYDLPQNSVLIAKIPEELVERYRSNKINKIDLNSNKSISLYDCLNQYLAIEKLSETDRMFCNNCHSLQVATKRLEIVYAPNVLLLQSKRSKNNSRRNKFDCYYDYSSKVNTRIDFPLELSLDNFVLQKANNESLIYDLIAVSDHSGSNFGGHYTTYAKNYLNNKWYLFNDSCVNEISYKQLVTQNAYLLVYLKRQN